MATKSGFVFKYRVRNWPAYNWALVRRGSLTFWVDENAVSRFEALVGVKLAARTFENQQVEALVKCRLLNRMASLGMPISERILQG